MLEFKSIDHINFTVKDLKQSSKFYQDVFGFKVFEDEYRNGSQYKILGISGKAMVCLYEKKTKDFEQVQFKESRFNHVGFNINFVDGIVEKLESLGVDVRYYDGEAIIQYPNSRSIYISDPDGNEIELSSVTAGGL